MVLKKIKAGSLQLVLFVGAIIAVLLVSFVLLTYVHTLFLKKTDVTVEVIQAADFALTQALLENPKEGEVRTMVYPNDLNIETAVTKSYWGLLPLYRATAKKQAIQFNKFAFAGHSKKNREALFLKDNLRPLVLAGNTKISGTTFLPERGVKRGNIAGNGYRASRLVFGEQKRSGPDLPKLTGELDHQFQGLYLQSNTGLGEKITLKKGTQARNSFGQETQRIEGDVVDLEGVTLVGNILVRASQKIVVRASSQLRDVVLIAPDVEIEPMATGVFQVFATTTIKVGKSVKLDYPSVLAIKAESNRTSLQTPSRPNIELGENAQIRGMVVFESNEEEMNLYTPNIKIDKRAFVLGEVYCTHNVELKGSVYGSLITNGFISLEQGNIYQNHIYNGRIESELLPDSYSGLCFESSKINSIAKWVY